MSHPNVGHFRTSEDIASEVARLFAVACPTGVYTMEFLEYADFVKVARSSRHILGTMSLTDYLDNITERFTKALGSASNVLPRVDSTIAGGPGVGEAPVHVIGETEYSEREDTNDVVSSEGTGIE